jgi:Fe-S-cluster containining protein
MGGGIVVMGDAEPESMDSFWRACFAAAAEASFDRALRELYGRVDARIAEHRPVCRSSGRCCKFDTYGHRLYVTAMEIAWFLRAVHGEEEADQGVVKRGEAGGAGMALPQWRGAGLADECRYQVEKRCTVHAVRPLGCRVFFCEAGTEKWQRELYEAFLTDLREIHNRGGLPYRYIEWRSGLAEASGAMDGGGG